MSSSAKRPVNRSARQVGLKRTFGEKRWEQVLSVAAETFGEQGYRAATLEEIASKLGILKGSLYHYIDNKEDLLFEILKRSALERIRVVTEDDMCRRADAPTRLTVFIRKWMRYTKDSTQYRMLSETEIRYIQDSRKAEIRSLHSQLGGIAFDIIQTGITEGSFAPTVNPYVATRSLFQLLFTMGRWHQPDGLTTFDSYTEWYVQMMIGGLTSDRPVQAPGGEADC